MIILNKNRISLIITSVFLSILVFVLTTDKSENYDKYISTVSLPVSGKTVVIDAGHGIPDEGVYLLTL